MRSSPTPRPTRTSGSSTACSPRPPTPSAWLTTGSISRASARPTAFSTIITTACCGRGGIGSSSRSRVTGRSTSSGRGSSPATCCLTRRASRSSRPRILRVGKRTTENGAIDAEYKAEYMVERTDNALGVAFLGLTVGCARCHDHKYDPIKQTDYYSLGAFFNSNDEPGAYAPGFSGIQGGPTLPWPDDSTPPHCAKRPQKSLRNPPTMLLRKPLRPSRARGRGALGRLPTDAAARIRATLADALAAHYEFESARPAQLADLPPPRTPHIPPRGTDRVPAQSLLRAAPAAERDGRATPAARSRRARAARAAQLQRRVVDAVARRDAGMAPAVIQGPLFRPGVRGQALFFDETNRGFLGRDVGYYDRSDPFTLDFWFYAAPPTTTCPSSIIWPSRTRDARAIDSRSTTASSGHRSHTRRPRT